MSEKVINVKGMMCNGCENRIKNALGSMEGVKEVTADHNTGKVTVKYEDNIEINALEEKIEDIGFEVVKED